VCAEAGARDLILINLPGSISVRRADEPQLNAGFRSRSGSTD
jgi:hypothetical protein